MAISVRKSSSVDLLHGPILKSMIVFAIPLFFSSVFQQLYNTMDTVIIGHTLGDEALAAMGAVVATFLMMIGAPTVGKKILPLFSSVIELIGKILFVVFLIPRFQYMAVIFCEPVIWCFMVAELLIAFWSDPFIRSKEEMPQMSV